MLNPPHCERARPGASHPCAVRSSWRGGAAAGAAAVELSPLARAWIAGVPWYEECVAHAWAHRAAAPATPAGLLQSVAEVRRCCECLLWSDDD